MHFRIKVIEKNEYKAVYRPQCEYSIEARVVDSNKKYGMRCLQNCQYKILELYLKTHLKINLLDYRLGYRCHRFATFDNFSQMTALKQEIMAP